MSDEIVIRCSRCSAHPHPGPIDAVRRVCSGCGAKVWLEAELPGDLAKRYPGSPLRILCLDCDPGPDVGAVMRPTIGQIERLLRAGLSPEDVAHRLAVAAVSGGQGSLEHTELAVLTDPHGPLAARYRDALIAARIDVAGIVRRN